MKQYYFSRFFFAVLLSLTFASCSLFDYEATVPAYISVPSFSFTAGVNQGTSSSQITDAWIYIDGKNAGAYELPATVPILASGTCNVQILPGIKLNGIGATRAVYSFYNQYQTSITLTPDSVVTITPTTTYADGLIFDFIEDYESVGMIFDKTDRSDTGIIKLNNPEQAFENWYGEINLSGANTFFEAKSTQAYELPKTTGYTFLEMNYKNDIPFVVGVFSNELNYITQHPVLVLNPTSVWKKVYVNLTPVVTRQTNAIDFNIFIASELTDGTTQGTIRIDNVKLIHY